MALNVNVQFKQSTAGLKTPKVEAGGFFRVYASEEAIFRPGESKTVRTQHTFDVPKGYILAIYPTDSASLRYGSSVHIVTPEDKEEVTILMVNSVPEGGKKFITHTYFLINGDRVENDYSKGLLPVNTIIVRKGDCIGKAFLVKTEPMTLTRAAKKAQETEDGEAEQ